MRIRIIGWGYDFWETQEEPVRWCEIVEVVDGDIRSSWKLVYSHMRKFARNGFEIMASRDDDCKFLGVIKYAK